VTVLGSYKTVMQPLPSSSSDDKNEQENSDRIKDENTVGDEDNGRSDADNDSNSDDGETEKVELCFTNLKIFCC